MTQQSAEPTTSTQEQREQMVSLYVRGNVNDAKAMYGAYPGANDAGWASLERMLAPVKSFIVDGEPPYVNPQGLSTEYQGIPVPEAEEAKPKEVVARAAEPSKEAREVEDDKPASAGELVDQARGATTKKELDEIEAQADGRVTVLNAVAAQREELGIK